MKKAYCPHCSTELQNPVDLFGVIPDSTLVRCLSCDEIFLLNLDLSTERAESFKV